MRTLHPTSQASMLYASELTAQALRLTPVGERHTGEDTDCAMCGRRLRLGDISSPLGLGASFTDYVSLSPSGHVCGFCKVTTVQANMRATQCSVITPKGFYRINTDANRAWFLLTPPEPPYVAVVSTGQMTATFHLHWRTPVTISNDLIIIRLHDAVSSIRRKQLLRSIDICGELATLMHAKAEGDASKRKRSIDPAKQVARHPFLALDRKLSNPMHGMLKEDAVVAARQADRLDLVDALRSLTQGELWALSTLVKANTSIPQAPELLTAPPPPKSKTDNDSK